jgi:glycosyltransferase involved in cell wall biosynthesis
LAILTVFTPTYNRAYCLHKCYESLTRQSCKDFRWLIIDDGSTDDTKKLVESWITENLISIRYVYQENQGMHGAHNTAYSLIDTELNICIDSDDYMADDAVEKIISYWEVHGNEKMSGIVALNSDTKEKVLGSMLPINISKSTLYDLYYKYGVTGDKKLVYRTDLIKKYPYPVFQGEKLVPLSYKYYMLDQHFALLLMNEVLCYVEYLPDGSSMNILSQYLRSANGFAFYRKELMKLPFAKPLFKFKQSMHFISSNLIMKNWNFLNDVPNKALVILAVPFGFLLYLYINFKSGEFNKGNYNN